MFDTFRLILCIPYKNIKYECLYKKGIMNVEESIKTTQNIANLFRRYNAVAGKLGCAHYDIGHEIRKGYF